jgi:hypothetical protein
VPGYLLRCSGAPGLHRGRYHRGFLELSYSLVEIACEVVSDEIVENHYGPGISAGYRYTSGGGFTFTAGAGVGDVPGEGNGTELMVLLGVRIPGGGRNGVGR